MSHESIDDFSWTLNGSKVESGGRFKAFNMGRKYTLSIKSAIPDDSGEVIFTARGLISKASLVVKGNETRESLGVDIFYSLLIRCLSKPWRKICDMVKMNSSPLYEP